jgi:hypothetical protein
MAIQVTYRRTKRPEQLQDRYARWKMTRARAMRRMNPRELKKVK